MNRYQSAHTVRETITRLMGVHQETQDMLAAGIGLSQSMISLKLSGQSRIRLEDVDRIAEHYGITPADLLSGAEVAIVKSLGAKGKGGSVVTD